MVERTMMCDVCRRHVNMSEVSYLPRGRENRSAVCASCRIKLQATDPSIKPKPAAAPVRKQSSSSKQSYFCALCRYKFKADAGPGTPKCPYCGKTTKVTEVKETSADELLRDTSDM
jgi:hypothetical protein